MYIEEKKILQPLPFYHKRIDLFLKLQSLYKLTINRTFPYSIRLKKKKKRFEQLEILVTHTFHVKIILNLVNTYRWNRL